MMLASISTASAVPTPFSLMKMICEVAKAPIATANSSAAAVTIRPVRSSPIATHSESEAPLSRASLIRESRKTRVVGREAEGDGEEQDRHRLLERPLAACSRAAPRGCRPGRSAPAARRRR